MAHTIYTMKELKDTARWTLQDVRCVECQRHVRLAGYELVLYRDQSVSASLHVTGTCARHTSYTVQKQCAI